MSVGLGEATHELLRMQKVFLIFGGRELQKSILDHWAVYLGRKRHRRMVT